MNNSEGTWRKSAEQAAVYESGRGAPLSSHLWGRALQVSGQDRQEHEVDRKGPRSLLEKMGDKKGVSPDRSPRRCLGTTGGLHGGPERGEREGGREKGGRENIWSLPALPWLALASFL